MCGALLPWLMLLSFPKDASKRINGKYVWIYTNWYEIITTLELSSALLTLAVINLLSIVCWLLEFFLLFGGMNTNFGWAFWESKFSKLHSNLWEISENFWKILRNFIKLPTDTTQVKAEKYFLSFPPNKRKNSNQNM